MPKVGSDGQPAATAPRKSRTRPHHFRVPMKRPKTHLRLDGEMQQMWIFLFKSFHWPTGIQRKNSGKSSSKGEMMVQERSNVEISSTETFYTSHPWHENPGCQVPGNFGVEDLFHRGCMFGDLQYNVICT